MDRGRILILGNSKESSFELRNLFDNHRFELEIALNKEIGKTVLSSRMMNLIVMHTETINEESEESTEFFSYLTGRGISLPLMVLGEDADSCSEKIDYEGTVACFEKPYPVADVLDYLADL
jgi:hypothetical protein|tara:strand:+ start:59 stop:421 length:363 start_codon:yes stop_codon:yes gene_type:complete